MSISDTPNPVLLLVSDTTTREVDPTARMQDCGGFTIAEKLEIPNIPRLEMVNVPPMNSSGASAPSRARVARSLTLAEIDDNPFVCALVTIGVIRP